MLNQGMRDQVRPGQNDVNGFAVWCSILLSRADLSVRVLSLHVAALVFGLMLLLSNKGLHAAEVKNLYRSVVPVADQGLKSRNEAVRLAMAEVLVRVSGAQSVLQVPQVKSALKKASTYLYQYSYLQKERLSNDGIPSRVLALSARFQPLEIRQLLKRSNLPIWPSHRPTIALWLITDDGQRQVVNEQSDDYLRQVIQEAGRRRGLPLTIPVWDLEEQLNVSEQAVWQLDHSRLYSASGRYQADSFLAGRVFQNGDGFWQGSWLFVHGGESYTLQLTEARLDAFIAKAVDIVADNLSKRYAVLSSPDMLEGMTLQLTGIDSYRDYRASMKYLTGLVLVKTVLVREVMPGHVVYQLLLDGDMSQLLKLLALDKKMRPLEGDLESMDADVLMRWGE
jgi:hypothetical protein